MNRVSHLSVETFAERARGALLAEPRISGVGGFGDYAIGGFPLSADAIAALRPAAVLIGVSRATGGVLFTERAAHLSKHPGQIAFPGGRIDAADAGPLEAALREAEEEVGLPSHASEVLGYLDEYFTGTGYRITPVVALINEFSPRIDPSEVAGLFEAPIDLLMDPARHEEHFREFGGRRVKTYAIPYESHYIWGVTAGIIRALHDRVFG